ncbi:MAG: discoidin domain-containing protein [Bacteroidales bacterium]|nr:discoidin domain-containing protein [Bacteroidales bacterium]
MTTFRQRTRNTRTMVLIIFLFGSNLLFSQQHFTPYDELPGMIKSYKPAYQEHYPDWAKKMYQFPVSAKEVDREFEAYMAVHPGRKSPVIRYYKIWRRVVESYTDGQGEIRLPDLHLAKRRLLESQLTAGKHHVATKAGTPGWSFLGPKNTYWLNEANASTAPSACPWQVNIYAFDVAASDNNVIYCGTETGLVNKSLDYGETWVQTGSGYPFGGGVTAVAVHPEESLTVYVAAGRQVHKTVDGGDTWIPLLGTTNQFWSDKLEIDPANPSVIYSAGSDGVFKSADGGATWAKRIGVQAWDVEIKPGDSNVVYALCRNYDNKFTILSSEDGGASFKDSGFPAVIDQASGGLISVSADKPNLLYAVLLSTDNEGTPYIYKGTRVADTWNWSRIAIGKTTALQMDNGQGFFDLVLDVSPNDADLVYVGTTTMFKSTNGGVTFTPVGGYYGNFAIHPDIQDIKPLPSGDTWVATDGGFSLSTDNFTSTANYISRNNGIIGSDMWGFDQGWNEDIIVGGRYHNGNTAIADFYGDKALRMGGAESPTGWVIHGKSRHVAFNDLGNGWILPKTAEGAPEGRFIFSKYPNMLEYGGRRGNLVHHPNYYDIIYLGEGNGIWVSRDMGMGFDLLYTFPGEVRYMDISFSDPDVMFADVAGRGLYKTTNGGETWEHMASLTSGDYGTTYWNGKLFFAISPTNANRIYACLSNGTWSADIGKVFRSTDGGVTWTDFTGSVSAYLKSLVIQPDENGADLLYLFTINKNGAIARVYYRSAGDDDWQDYSNQYPAGMNVNRAMAFYRDAKLRVGGSASVWEAPMIVSDFKPVVNPWVGSPFADCTSDTLQFDDHSILHHAGAGWEWNFSPEPVYVSDPNARNPRVVLGDVGSYDVTLTVTVNGNSWSKTIPGMVTMQSCPSIEDCNNPGEVPGADLSVLYVDSEEIPWGRYATNIYDGSDDTFWHTAWSTANPPHPHEVQLDLDTTYEIHAIRYVPRQSSENGRIRDYEFYVSGDSSDWGEPVASGAFPNSNAPQTITLDSGVPGRYFRLVALSEVNDNVWTSVAEITLTGCYEEIENQDTTTTPGIVQNRQYREVRAYPLPADEFVQLELPGNGAFQYDVYTVSGEKAAAGVLEQHSGTVSIGIRDLDPGLYIVLLKDAKGTRFRVKLLKE